MSMMLQQNAKLYYQKAKMASNQKNMCESGLFSMNLVLTKETVESFIQNYLQLNDFQFYTCTQIKNQFSEDIQLFQSQADKKKQINLKIIIIITIDFILALSYTELLEKQLLYIKKGLDFQFARSSFHFKSINFQQKYGQIKSFGPINFDLEYIQEIKFFFFMHQIQKITQKKEQNSILTFYVNVPNLSSVQQQKRIPQYYKFIKNFKLCDLESSTEEHFQDSILNQIHLELNSLGKQESNAVKLQLQLSSTDYTVNCITHIKTYYQVHQANLRKRNLI